MKSPLIKIIITLPIVGIILLLTLTAYQGKKLASPTRRTIQDYHLDWLDYPNQHGVVILKTMQLGGKVPCLTVTPDGTATLGKRGSAIRQQLEALGFKLHAHGSITGTVVLLHGRNGCKEDLLPAAERFCAIGLRCIIPDLPAHGESPILTVQFGASDWERNLPLALLNECASEQNFPTTPCALWGMSMGGSFATHAASAGGPWQSLIIVSSFDHLETLIQLKTHSQLITNLTSYFCQEYDGVPLNQVTPSQWAKSVKIPVLVAHGSEDTLIPEASGKRLFESFASPQKQWIEVPEADHHNVLITAMPLYAEMGSWLLRSLGMKVQTTEPPAAPPAPPKQSPIIPNESQLKSQLSVLNNPHT